jgi:hypothetical protein
MNLPNPIGIAISAVKLPDGISVILIVHEAIYNDTADHSLFSEFQLRDLGIEVDSISHKHGGTPKMMIKDVGSSIVILLKFAGCMIHFKHRLQTIKEIRSLKQYCLTQGDTPWNPSSFLIKLQTCFINRSLIINKKLILITD